MVRACWEGADALIGVYIGKGVGCLERLAG